jgi:hypothetical protein
VPRLRTRGSASGQSSARDVRVGPRLGLARCSARLAWRGGVREGEVLATLFARCRLGWAGPRRCEPGGGRRGRDAVHFASCDCTLAPTPAPPLASSAAVVPTAATARPRRHRPGHELTAGRGAGQPNDAALGLESGGQNCECSKLLQIR